MPRRPTTRLRLTTLEDRLTPAGGLDSSFGTNGIVTTAPGHSQSSQFVLTQPDGHILLVGADRLTRYNADGSVDTTFGTGGSVSEVVPGRGGSLGSAVVGPDGKITLSGVVMATRPMDPNLVYTMNVTYTTAVVRLNADGTPDLAFGTGGVVSYDAILQRDDTPGFPHAISSGVGGDLTLLPDGSVVVSGNDYLSYTAVRLTPAGAIDTTFGVNGLFRHRSGTVGSGFLNPVTVAATPDGGVFLEGSEVTLDSHGLADATATLLKLTPAGTLDTSFDGDGVASVSAGHFGGVYGLAVQPDGKVLLVTSVYDPTQVLRPTSVDVLRLNADGTPDTSFGGDGRAAALPGGSYAGSYGIALLADGRVVVASGRQVSTDAAVAVLNADGTPDDYFANGTGAGNFGYGPNQFFTMMVDGVATSGDRIVVVSSLYDYPGETLSFPLNRRTGLAVLTEGPTALPLTPPPPVVVVDPPVLTDPPVFIDPPIDGEVVRTVFVDPVLTDPPVPIGPPVTFPVPLPQPVKVSGDLNGDGFADKVVTVGSTVSVVSGSDGRVLVKPFAPFEASYTGTLNAVFVDATGDGTPELVVSPGQGGGPVVAVYNADGTERGRFWGIDDAGFRGGVNLASGDVDFDGRPDLIVTAGEGGGPRVAIFDGRTLGTTPTRLVADFFAFEPDQRGGATAGVANGVLIFGAGPGGGPRVRGIDGRSLVAAAGVKSLDDLPAAGRKFDRFVGDPSSRGGVKLDFSGVTSQAADQPSKVTAKVGDGPAVTVYDSPGFNPAS